MLVSFCVLVCNNDDCKKLPERWEEAFKKGVAITVDLQTEGHPGDLNNPDTAKRFKEIKGKCEACRKERAARSAVAMTNEDERLHKEPFATAPYIHQLNDPKHAANVSRSMRWAKENKHTVNWVPAHDYPLHRDDQATCLFYHQRNI